MTGVGIYKEESGVGISNGVLGMVFLLVTELMFFGGLVSAFIVNKAGWDWPPVGQPRLPVEVTAVNTFILIFSAITIYLVTRNFHHSGAEHSKGDSRKVKKMLIWTMAFGIIFVVVQGVEWVRLLGFGLTTTSSLYGAFFYTIIGAHGLHVLAGLSILIYLWFYLKKPNSFEAKRETSSACSLYWYFVVGIWPVLYVLVYLT